mmetsp:Transcript_7815/g.25957  ORF Transcript_7815/g.25957 Transcript_7815/m.25957 type:complete len:95 (-) Transcript_7815:31-315(-)
MPWTSPLAQGLTAFGLACFAGTVVAYKRGSTPAMKAAYGLTWVTLGPGVLIGVQPDPDSFRQMLEDRGTLDAERLRELREVREAQVEALKRSGQ